MDTMTKPTRPKPTLPARRPRWTLGVLVVAAILAVGFLVSLRTTSPRSAVPVPAEPVTTAPAVAVVPAVATPPDFTAIVKGIVATANELRIHPDPARLATYLEPSNPDYADALVGQSQLASGAIRYDPPPTAPVVGQVQVVASDADTATLTVNFTATPRYRVVDRTGAILNDNGNGGIAAARWTLHRTGDNTWRIASQVAL